VRRRKEKKVAWKRGGDSRSGTRGQHLNSLASLGVPGSEGHQTKKRNVNQKGGKTEGGEY